MTVISAHERVLRSDCTPEECKKIEKILRSNNISYFEKWKNRKGIMKLFGSGKNRKCDIYIHKDSYGEAKRLLGDKV